MLQIFIQEFTTLGLFGDLPGRELRELQGQSGWAFSMFVITGRGVGQPDLGQPEGAAAQPLKTRWLECRLTHILLTPSGRLEHL
jgi:hypothetical protein